MERDVSSGSRRAAGRTSHAHVDRHRVPGRDHRPRRRRGGRPAVLAAWVPPEAVALLTVDTDGVHHTITRVHGSGHRGGPIFWSALLGFLVFEPSGTPHSGAMRAAVEEFARPQLSQRFAGQVREILAPPASVLFLLVEDADPDLVLEAVKRYGGRTLRAS